MDKSKIIDWLVNEWALRSPDGLAGGYDTPENIRVLNEILAEKRGRPTGWIDSKFLTPIDPKEKTSVDILKKTDPSKLMIFNNHPKYPDGTVYQKILDGEAVSKKGDLEFPIQADPGEAEREDLQQQYFRPYHGYWITDNHPEYRDGIRYNDIKYHRAAKKSSAAGIAGIGRVATKELKWTVDDIEDKNFNRPSAQKIYDSLTYLSAPLQRDFLEKGYNKLSPEQAVAFINARFDQYEKFIDALDAARMAAGKGNPDDEIGSGGAGSKAGRGEFLLVLLIKGATSAGSESGDITAPGVEGAIEVKEITANGFRATKASFGKGGFYRLKYISAINELIGFCNKSLKSKNEDQKTYGDVLLNMCKSKKEGIDKDFWDSLGKDIQKMTEQFFEYPSLESLNSSAAYGLEAFGEYLRGINEKEAALDAMPNTVEFDLKKTTTTMKIEDMPPQSKEKVLNPSKDAKPQQVTMSVAPITKEDEEEVRLIIPAAKRLEFFKYKASEKDIYTPENIAKEMFSAMKSGHYKGGIIFYSKNVGFYYERDLDNLKHGSWYFYSYQQTGPVFVRDERTKPSE